MKYLILGTVLCVNGILAMHPGEMSKAKKIRDMQKWIEESKEVIKNNPQAVEDPAPANAEPEKVTPPRKGRVYPSGRSGSPTPLLDMIQEYTDKQLEGLESMYKEAIEVITMHSNDRDQRIVTVLERQTDTIQNLSDMVKRLMSNGMKVERQVTVQKHEIGSFKDDVDNTIGRLMDAVGDQAQMFVQQNAVIRELMARIEKQKQKEADQARKLALHSMAIKKLQALVDELSEKYTEKQVDELLEYFGKVLKDLKEPAVVQEPITDAELERQVFGDTADKAYEADAESTPVLKKESKAKEEEMETIIIEEYVEE